MYIDWQSNAAKRTVTSIAIVAVLAAAFALRLLTVWVFDVLILIIACIAVWEIMKARRSDTKGVASHYVYSYIFIVYMMFLTGVLLEFKLWLHVVMQAIVFGIFALYTYLMNYMDKDFIKEATLKKKSAGKHALTPLSEFLKVVIWPFAMLFALIIINHMGAWAQAEIINHSSCGSDGHNHTSTGELSLIPMVGTFALLLVFVISCFTDTFAYVVGMTIRGPKMLPQKFRYISPNKSISGAIGGLFGGIVGALLVVLLCSMNTGLQEFLTARIGESWKVQLVFVFVGLVGAILTMWGDLHASWLKRKVKIKDYGKILPGHGGIMDRLDGISFNAVLIWFVMMLVVFV